MLQSQIIINTIVDRLEKLKKHLPKLREFEISDRINEINELTCLFIDVSNKEHSKPNPLPGENGLVFDQEAIEKNIP